MYPPPHQYNPTSYLRQFPVPGPVRASAVMLWLTAGVSFTVLAINMGTAPMYGVDLEYAFFYSSPHTLIGVLALIPAVPLVRGRPWARTMAKVVLISQMLMQAMNLTSPKSLLWSLLLLPLAIAGVILLERPVTKRFFAAHSQAANQEYLQRHAAQQWGQGQHPPQQWGQAQYPPQQWGQGHHPNQPPYPPQQAHGHHPPYWGQHPDQQ